MRNFAIPLPVARNRSNLMVHKTCWFAKRRIMIVIENTLVSDEIFTEKFCCNLKKCKGCCCVEGDAGAPLEEDEAAKLKEFYDDYKEYMTPKGREIIEKTGSFYDVFEPDGSLMTPLIDGRDCVYISYGDDGMAFCAVEKAFREGKIPFRKPISCYLFPVRIQKYLEYDAVNYFRWNICRDAEVKGRREGIPVFRFLKEPLIERYGQEWYAQAEAVYKEVFNS